MRRGGPAQVSRSGSSALDDARIERGRDVGNVVVTRGGRDVPHVTTFAFAFFAFHRDGVLHTERGPLRQPR